MSEFTKGKWEADAKTIRTLCKVFRTVRVGDIGDDIAIAVIPAIHGVSEQELLANTRLIAAAPEMYELLQNLADGWNMLSNRCMMAKHAYDDIVKLLARIDGTEEVANE